MIRAMVVRTSGQRRIMWQVALLSLVALSLFSSTAAAASAIQDDGALFSQTARNDFTTREAQIERDTGKQIVVRTVASLNGKDISAQADAAFAQLNVNGVLLYASKADKSLSIKTGPTTRQAISTQEEGQIRDQMLASFRTNDFDGGLLNATDRVGRDLRAVFTGTNTGANTNRSGANQPATTSATPAAPRATGGGIGIGAILVVLLLIVAIVFVARRIFGRNNNTGVSGGPYGGGGGNVGTNYAPPPQPGYGNNYGGGGYGQPSQGGGFGSSVAGGAVGGFGGAILGNAVYDHFRDANGNDRNGNPVNTGGNAGNNGPYQDPNNDAGRVDDSYQDTGSWGNGGGDNSAAAGGGSDPGTGSWGGDGGAGAGDSGGDSGGGGDTGGGSWA